MDLTDGLMLVILFMELIFLGIFFGLAIGFLKSGKK